MDPKILLKIEQSNRTLLDRMKSRFNLSLGFDAQSIQTIDQMINQFREQFKQDIAVMEVAAEEFGVFLGECLVRNAQGQWVEDDGQLMVQLNFGRANPLGKARKHIEHDASESIFGFYLSTIALVNQHAGKHGTQEKVRKEPDGAVINESYSTNAPHVKASLWRLMKHDDDLRLWSNLILIAGFGVFFLSVWGARLISQDQVLWGGILLALGIALLVFLLYFSILFLRALHMTRVMFYNALLSPAMIISLDPLKLACVAEMGNGRDGDYWGWKMREVKDLPGHHRQLHEIIPCVSVFRDGPGDHHADFDPRPICWGTSDKKEVERCLQKTDREALEQLQMLIRDGNFAQLSDEVRIVGH